MAEKTEKIRRSAFRITLNFHKFLVARFPTLTFYPRLKGVGYTVAITSTPMIGYLFDTIIVALSKKESGVDPSKHKCSKMMKTVTSRLKLLFGW